jgi:undecaprenyl diphosphate synthase
MVQETMTQESGPAETALFRALPKHIAIIMDGNGRWAMQRGLPRAEGHRRGVESTKACVRAAGELGIAYLTLFSFSSENWRRPADEVETLMSLMRRFVRRDLAELHENNVRLRVIGREDGIDADLLVMIREAVALTANNTGLQLTVAFNYGGRDEIARAARRIAECVRLGTLRPEEITEQTVASHFDTAGLPDPDLLIRTSGEQRISNFLLWQCAYAEFVFVNEYWPDFTKRTLEDAISLYQSRHRRFGGLKTG